MGQPVLIYGKSGSGKSRSLKGFGADEILLINVERKMLPRKVQVCSGDGQHWSDNAAAKKNAAENGGH